MLAAGRWALGLSLKPRVDFGEMRGVGVLFSQSRGRDPGEKVNKVNTNINNSDNNN